MDPVPVRVPTLPIRKAGERGAHRPQGCFVELEHYGAWRTVVVSLIQE